MNGLERLNKVVEDLNNNYLDLRNEETRKWVIKRAKHYEEKTGISFDEIIDMWEDKRNYSFINYYQDSNQPLLDRGMFMYLKLLKI